MSKIDLYTGIVGDLTNLTYTGSDGGTRHVKTIALWRNQLEREKDEIPFLFDAVFIEFLDASFIESASKIYQQVNLTVRVRLAFETKKTEDLDVLRFAQKVYQTLQGKSYGTWGKMKRRNEQQDFDHSNVQVYIQDYLVDAGKDYSADERPTTEATINNIVITPQIGIDE